MAFLDRNLLIGFGAGVLVGLVGYKLYNSHKDEIGAKLQQFGVGAANGGDDACACQDDACEISVEDLEAQKERLEDLIAEQKQKQQAAAVAANESGAQA